MNKILTYRQRKPDRALSIVYCAFSTLFSLLIFLFLWLRIPQYLLYQEQYQLFLFTGDYFLERISMPGSFADYISEFIVQFYYVPLYGALLTALVLTLSQVFLGLACRRCSIPGVAYALAAIPPVLCLAALSDENTLLSLPITLLIVSLAILLFSIPKRRGAITEDIVILIVPFLILYWLVGPFAFVYIMAIGILRRTPFAAVISLIAGVAFVWILQRACLQQYPLSRLLLGINYYRVPEIYPVRFFIIAAVTSLLPFIESLTTTTTTTRLTTLKTMTTLTTIILAAAIFVPYSFDDEKSRILTYESLVRQGRWSDIISRAKSDRPSDEFSLQAINLALGMTGQLAESMFEYDQKGIRGLIDRNNLDNTSPLVIAEALFRLGLTNIAFSTTFDIQESIMNDRKSGRFMKRLAECMIINGNYKVAEKYIGYLRNSLFYSDWAKSAEKLLGNDQAVEAHAVYGPLRRNGFKQVAFYNHTQIDRILAIHAADNEGFNQLAWQYFYAAAMLKGELPVLAGIFNSHGKFVVSQSAGRIPRHIQEALAMYWTFTHPSFEGIPYPITPEIQHQTAALAQASMQYPDNPSAWQSVAPSSFSLYFLNLRHSSSPQPTPSSPRFTH